MRKAIMAGLTAIAVFVSAFLFAPLVRGQGVPRPTPHRERRMQILEGRGSAIGASIRDLNADEAAKAKLQPAGGVSVQAVEDGSPAAKAGLRVDDMIVEFDGERVRSARHLTRLVRETPDGRTVKATVLRNGIRQTVEITPDAAAGPFAADIVLPDIEREIERGLQALPRNFSFDFDADFGFGRSQRRLGITAAPLTGQLAEYFKVKEGVLVSSVAPDSPAAKAGLRAGDVITSVNGRSMDSPRELTEELRDVKPGTDVELGITRDGKAITLKATIPEPERRRFTRPA